jgi:hypothetical protein
VEHNDTNVREKRTGKELSAMTVPEENRRTTKTTGQVPRQPDNARSQEQGGTGRTLREALEEARVHPDDFAEKEAK